MLQGLCWWFDLKYCVHLEFNIGSGSWDLKWLIVEWSDIGWARYDCVHQFYSLNVMIWVCVKFEIAAKLWVNICRSICWFISVKARVHTSYTLPSSVYKGKAFSSGLTDLSDPLCCFTAVCQWSLTWWSRLNNDVFHEDWLIDEWWGYYYLWLNIMDGYVIIS